MATRFRERNCVSRTRGRRLVRTRLAPGGHANGPTAGEGDRRIQVRPGMTAVPDEAEPQPAHVPIHRRSEAGGTRPTQSPDCARRRRCGSVPRPGTSHRRERSGDVVRIGLSIGSAYYDGSDWDNVVELVRVADRAGVEFAWSAEAWGMEAVAPLAYLAAVTERITLGTGIMQISARTASMTAMTALTMARLTNDRFALGLGVSGPQVVEGLHGGAFAHPLGRLREYVAVVKQAIAGERIVHTGEHLVLPRPGGEGKALRLSMPPKPDLPIYLATLGPKSLEFTGEAADGWLGTSFIPEAADEVIGHIRTGADRAGRSMAEIDLQVGVTIEIEDDVDAVIERHRPRLAFTLGAMGSAETNFYNAAYSRAGWAEVARDVQAKWVAGDREGAVRAVPDELVLSSALIGSEDMVLDRIRAHAAAGITTLRLSPTGRDLRAQIANLERSIAVIERAN